MSAADKQFTGAIPEIYDRYLVPLLFDAYARDMAERVATRSPANVLETAAGTGVLTRRLALRLPEPVRIVATDLNQPMLDYAGGHLPLDDRITWRQADALALPFGDRSFDIVACQFGVMFFPDKVQGYREACRVLKPGGSFLFSVWDQISANEFADAITLALAEVFPEDPPHFMARTPHGYCDVVRIKAELIEAGYKTVSIETRDDTSRGAGAREVALAYCQGTPLRNEIEARDGSRLEEATRVAADSLERRFGHGPIDGRIRALVITAAR